VSEGVAYAVVVRRIAMRIDAIRTFFKGGHFLMQVSLFILFLFLKIFRAYRKAVMKVRISNRKKVKIISHKFIIIKWNI
jgi:hypothetical protein